MASKRTSRVILGALFSAACIIGLAFYQRMPGAFVLPETASYVVQAAIVLLPQLWIAARRHGGR